MADIFISYSRNDRERVRTIATALEQHGFSVWWDPDIPPGESFSQVIDRQLKEAACIIAVWSQSSVNSNWVQEEADDGMSRQTLIPVMIDNIDLPRGFKRLQTADLIDWNGNEDDPNWQLILSQVHKLISASREKAAAQQRAAARSKQAQGAARQPTAQQRAPQQRAPQQRAAQQQARQAPAPAEKKGGSPIGLIALGALLLIGGGAAYYFLSGNDNDAATIAQTEPVATPVEEDAVAVVEEIADAEEDIAVAELADAAVTDDNSEDSLDEIVDELAAASEEDAATDAPAAEEEAVAAIAPGETFRDCDNCPQMVAIPAGSFQLGAPDDEFGRDNAELPQVAVEIVSSFALGKFEVTQDEWDACVEAGGCNGYEPADMGWGGGARPVVNVSYADANAYVQWLSEETGETYRLPSEAEWEYAARAGTDTPFAFGDSISTSQANFDGQYPYRDLPKQSGRGRTVEVGTFGANEFGLHDMHGNVWEWTADCWRANHNGAPEDGSPVGGACSSRPMKGGAWVSGAWRVRSAHRRQARDTKRGFDLGFRVAREIQ